MSSLAARRPSAIRDKTAARMPGSGASRRIPSVSSTAPGVTEFTRTPAGPHSKARVRDNISTPAFAAQTCACIGMALGASPLILLSFGVYLVPILDDTHWNRALIAGSIGAPMILAGLMSPLVGWLTNRLGCRRVVMAGFPLCGVAMMLLATPTSAAMFVATMVLAGVLISGQTLTPYVYCVTGWFEARRGMALGIMLACTGVGLAIAPPVAAHLIGALGWRGSYLAFGAFVAAVGLPVGRWLIVDPPANAVADRRSVAGMTWRQALATPAFWLLTCSITAVGAAVSAGTVNLHVLLVERGVGAARASFAMSLLGLSMIGARLVFGTLFDRVSPRLLTSFICLMVAAAFVTLAATSGPAGVLAAAVMIGAGFGAEGDALSYMSSRLFGLRDFGVIFGAMFMAFTLGGGLGPVIFAILRSTPGGETTALWSGAAAGLLGTVMIACIRDDALVLARRRAKPAVEQGQPA